MIDRLKFISHINLYNDQTEKRTDIVKMNIRIFGFFVFSPENFLLICLQKIESHGHCFIFTYIEYDLSRVINKERVGVSITEKWVFKVLLKTVNLTFFFFNNIVQGEIYRPRVSLFCYLCNEIHSTCSHYY